MPVLQAQLAAGQACGEIAQLCKLWKREGWNAESGKAQCTTSPATHAHHTSQLTRRTRPGACRRRSRGGCTSRAPPASSGGTSGRSRHTWNRTHGRPVEYWKSREKHKQVTCSSSVFSPHKHGCSRPGLGQQGRSHSAGVQYSARADFLATHLDAHAQARVKGSPRNLGILTVHLAANRLDGEMPRRCDHNQEHAVHHAMWA